MRFGVLGPLAVWTDAGEPVTVPGVKVRALLADLLLFEGRAVSADRLIEDVWGENPPGNPAGTLSAKVSQLRKALGDAEPGGRELVLARPPGYQLVVEPEAVDALRFQTLVTEAAKTDDPQVKAASLTEALELWRGPALADFADEPFTQATIGRLAEMRLTAYEDQAEARLALGDHAMLVGELAELLAQHPLRERLRAAYMRALYASGRQSEALDSFAELRETLADELGLDPGPELVALHQAILAQDPALGGARPVRAVRERPRTNLPAALTGLIGRDDAVAEVRDRLATDRLVTLTGPGGVGKTRMALETAGGLVGDFPDGTWLVELAALPAGSNELSDAVLTVLDIRDAPGRGPQDRLAEAVRGKRMLLVLDNCEHLIGPAAELAGALLAAAPGLRLLVTSREPLGLPGEVVWNVPPLDVPERQVTDPAELTGVPAVRLFVERAGAAARGFTLDAETAEPVAVLCRRLDGIPLALELAATRVRALGVRGVVARLDDRLRLLATGHRGAPPRQQTLLAMIDWSWELLTDPERIVLRRLAAHTDGCTLEAAEAVCAGDGVAAMDVLDLLIRLVDRSLVTMVETGGDAPRYRLLESVAAYCTERLREAGEYDRLRERHQQYYTDLAERARPGLYGPEQREWLRRLDADAANLRTALDGPVAEDARRLANALAWYWFLRGRLTEARRSLESALARTGGTQATALAWETGFAILQGDGGDIDAALQRFDDPAERARAEWFLGWVGLDSGDVERSEQLLNKALASFRTTGDKWGEGAALTARAKCAHVRGALEDIEHDADRAAELFAELGDRWGALQAAEWRAALAEMTGDYARAKQLALEGLALAEELELWPEVAGRLGWLGWIAVQECDFERAREHSAQAVRMGIEQGNEQVRIFGELGLGFAARRSGDLDLADVHLRNLVDTAKASGTPQLYLPMVLAELGFTAELRGDAATAMRFHLDAYEAGQTIYAARDLPWLVEGMAGALALAGHHTEAARLLGAAEAGRATAAMPPSPAEQPDLDRITGVVRAALGVDAFTAAFAAGAELTCRQSRDMAEATVSPP
jgi:predicted ATPase/DNA-binding SARP family transcriptional activator